MLRTLAILGLLATSAAADPLTLQAGAGLRIAHHDQNMWDTGNRTVEAWSHDGVAPALSLMLGYRLRLDAPIVVAIGGRAAVSRTSWHDERYVSSGSYDTMDAVYYPVDLAVTVQLERGRVWLAPWIGTQSLHAHVTNSRYDDVATLDWSTDLAAGASLGVDVVRSPHGSFGVVLDAERSAGYSAVGLGLAYRQ